MNAYFIAALGYLLWVLLSWFLANALGLKSRDFWIFCGGLWFLGAVATAAILWYWRKRRQLPPLADSEAAKATELQFLLRSAARQLSTSLKVRRGARRIAELPATLLLGPPGSSKTSLVLNSGTEPELLAGQIYQDNLVASTRTANIWLASGWIVAEAGGTLLASPGLCGRLFRGLKAGTISGLFSGRPQAPRSIVVTCAIDELLTMDSQSLAAEARRILAALSEAAVAWGARMPVYVLFTKLDRVSYFNSFVRNMTDQEAAQVVGITLRQSDSAASGVWAERETQLLAGAFDQIFRGLADKRLDHLLREPPDGQGPDIYEFPREFRKLRDSVVLFLLEISRPSQLRTTPFLRGFYFTGVRPVVVDERNRATPPAAVAEPQAFNPEATRIFSAQPTPATPAAALFADRPGQTRKIPQWVFLSHFFAHVLLADRSAIGTSSRSPRAALLRRILLATASALGVIYLAGATISYLRNREFILSIQETASQLATTRVTVPGNPTIDDLRRLDRLRQAAQDVTNYEKYGAPFFQRWGLYPGKDLHDRTRAAYCAEFQRFLFNDAQTAVVAALRKPGENYERAHRTLRAYLVSTTYPAEAKEDFLAPLLGDKWSEGREVTPEVLYLARQQFRFYASQRSSGYCPAKQDADALANARQHLSTFPVFDRTYHGMIQDLSSTLEPVRFNDPAGAVVNPFEVRGAFTKAGWARAQSETIAEKYVSLESWVLGEKAQVTESPQELSARIRARYRADFIKQWQQFLQAGYVPKYGNFNVAAQKLRRIAEAQSPLLQMFCLISTHTNVENGEVLEVFKGIQTMVPPATCANTPNNVATTGDYLLKLSTLQAAVENIAKSPATEEVSLPEAAQAKIAAAATAQTNNLSPVAQALLEAPIIHADDLAKRKLPQDLNAKGGGFCRDLAVALFAKYPFNPRNTAQPAQIEDLNAVFLPATGRIATFYEESLKALLTMRGSRFEVVPLPKVPVNEGFLRYFNKLADIKSTFYPGTATTPGFAYNIRIDPSPDLENATLQIDGRRLSGRSGASAEFVWPGDRSGVVVTATIKGQTVTKPLAAGMWSIFQFFEIAERKNAQGTSFGWDLYPPSFGRPGSGPPLGELRLSVSIKGPAPLFAPGYLSGGCVDRIAR